MLDERNEIHRGHEWIFIFTIILNKASINIDFLPQCNTIAKSYFFIYPKNAFPTTCSPGLGVQV